MEARTNASQAALELFEEHGAAVYRFARALLRHHQDAEDVVQETFVKLLRHLTDGGNGPKFSKTPIPTPYCSVTLPRRKPTRLAARDQVAGV